MADEVAISGKPYEKVANLTAPTVTVDNARSSMTVKSSWKNPSNLTAKTNPRRAEMFSSWFGMYASTPQLAQTANLLKFGGDGHYGSVPTTGANITSSEYTFEMARFYPFSASGPKVKSLYVFVDPVNSAGSAEWANKTYAAISMLAPAKPTVSAPEFDDENGEVSCTVKSTSDDGTRHWHSTVIRRDCFDSQTGNTATATYTTSSSSYDVPSVDVAGVDTIQGSRYWRYSLTATARGLAGDSDAATASLYVAQPKVPTITSCSVAGTKANSKVSVSLRTNATKEHPVTGMRLQVLRSSPYTTAAQAVADLQGVGWEDMGVVDDGQCTCLVTEVSEVRPDADTHTWVRVKVWDLSETRGHLHNWSAPVQLTKLETKSPTAANDKCGVILITPSKSGVAATVQVGFNEDGTNTGTELSWSTAKGAWSSSNASLSTAQYTQARSAGTGVWKYRVTLSLTGLDQGTTYYLRARRYLTVGSDTTYSPYSTVASFTTESAVGDTCRITTITPSKTGTSAVVALSWTSGDGNTGTEISWATTKSAWNSSGGVSTGTTTASTYTINELTSGTTYYVRARRYKEAGSSTTYGKYSDLASFTTESATDDKCGIVSTTTSSGGTSATVVIGFTEDNTNTGTELTWSTYRNAWNSTTPPESFTFTWRDSTRKSTAWGGTTTVYMNDLETDTTYYLRARRYLEAGGNTTRTPWSKLGSFHTPAIPEDTAANDTCGIVSATPSADGTYATVVVGFSEDNVNTGTQLAWSTDRRAWNSTQPPDTFDATWRDSTRKSTDWDRTATIYLKSLEPNETYYLRARRYLEGNQRTYTPWSAIQSMETSIDEAKAATIAIVSAASGEDGLSADLVIGWSEDAEGTGTEVTWSDREDAWESTDQPESFQATWSDAKRKSSAWKKTQTVHVEGLEQGTKYWFRARRYSSDDGATYSPWSNAATVIPAVEPTSVTLTAPAFVERGRAVDLSWTYGGGSEQTAWRVMHGRVTVASGDDPVTGCVVAATRFAQLTRGASSYALTVEVSTGGDFVASAPVTVGIADRPTLAVSDAEVTAQPVALTLTCSTNDASVAIVMTAAGATGDTPSGTRTQALGDTVWSAVTTPVWTGSGPYTATVIAPTDLDLWDGARYLVEAVATDRRTGLSSDAAMGVVTVSWTHSAIATEDATVTPADVTDELGRRSLRCSVTPVAPEGASSTDVCDVYRVTSDGADLVAPGIPFGTTVVDEYATLGHASYRVCTRTADGDLDWLDFAYDLMCGSILRVDWDGGYVELPYNVSVSDSYQKDFEGVRDLTGEVEGYWNSGATHRQSLSTDVIKIRSASVLSSLRKLAHYAGPTFVRTPDGCAYQANVDVSGIDSSHGSAAVSVALDATEVALTSEFMVKMEGD